MTSITISIVGDAYYSCQQIDKEYYTKRPIVVQNELVFKYPR